MISKCLNKWCPAHKSTKLLYNLGREPERLKIKMKNDWSLLEMRILQYLCKYIPVNVKMNIPIFRTNSHFPRGSRAKYSVFIALYLSTSVFHILTTEHLDVISCDWLARKNELIWESFIHISIFLHLPSEGPFPNKVILHFWWIIWKKFH